MKTGNLSLTDLATSVLVVPPLARNPDLTLNRSENRKLIAHIEAGGASTMLYGGNANLYHIPCSEYAETLEFLAGAVAADTWLIPSAGPDYGRLMDQALILRDLNFPTVMALPNSSPSTTVGLASALRRFADKFQRSIVLYIKTANYLPPKTVKQLVDDGVVFAVKYAVVCDDPRQDVYLCQLLEHVDTDHVMSGLGELPAIVHLREFGLKTFTTGSGAIAPRASGALLTALQNKQYEEAEAIRAAFLPLENCRNKIHPICVLHEAVTLCGVANTGPILPFLHNLEVVYRREVQVAAQKLLAYEQATYA